MNDLYAYIAFAAIGVTAALMGLCITLTLWGHVVAAQNLKEDDQ